MQTYELGMPWITYTYLTSDRRTRITGRSRIECSCSICGDRTVLKLRIPRFGRVPEPVGGRHAARLAYLSQHEHPAEMANRVAAGTWPFRPSPPEQTPTYREATEAARKRVDSLSPDRRAAIAADMERARSKARDIAEWRRDPLDG